jgi:hypothetical protein
LWFAGVVSNKSQLDVLCHLLNVEMIFVTCAASGDLEYSVDEGSVRQLYRNPPFLQQLQCPALTLPTKTPHRSNTFSVSPIHTRTLSIPLYGLILLIALFASFYTTDKQPRVLIGRAALTEPFYAYIVGIPTEGTEQGLLLGPQSGLTRARAILNLTQDLERKVYELMQSLQEGGRIRPIERTVKRYLDEEADNGAVERR